MSNSCNKCDYPHDLSTDCYIPDADCYIVSTDKFMSGWGFSTGLDNVCVVPCTWEEHQRVLDYVESRDDQMRVRLNITKPRNRGNWLISNLSSWKEQV